MMRQKVAIRRLDRRTLRGNRV